MGTPKEVLIRPAAEGDGGAILRMSTRIMRETVIGEWMALDVLRFSALVEWCLVHGIGFVAEVDEQVVGFAAAAPVEHELSGEKVLNVIALWIDPEFRFGRNGTRLIESMEAWALTNNVPIVKLMTPVGSRAGELLERQGYEPVEVTYLRRVKG